MNTFSLAFCVLFSVNALAADQDPGVRTQNLIEAFKQVKTAAEGAKLSAEDKKANESAFATLDGFLDFDRLTGDAIASNKTKLNAEQLKKYHTMFRELIRMIAYPDCGELLKRAKLVYKKPQTTGNKSVVVMDTSVPAEDFQLNVGFTWENNKGTWKLVDVSFGSGSLVKDYQNQFGRLIEKNKADGFIALLEKRYDKERRER